MSKIRRTRVDDVLATLNPPQFRILQHAAFGENIRSAADLADAIGVRIDRVAKTVLVGDHACPPERRIAEPSSSYVAVCLPSRRKINVSTVAEIFHWSGCQLATSGELVKVLGFKPGAVSPLGVGEIPLVVDETLMTFSTIPVGSGVKGIDIELDPRDLVVIVKARIGNVAIDSL